MELLNVFGIALVTVLVALVLKQHHKELGVLAAVAGGILLLVAVIFQLSPVLEQLRSWMDFAGGLGEQFGILLKSMGICFLTQFAADTCKDAGESALAGKVELAGKVSVVITALPLFQSIAQTALSLTGGSA